MPMALRAKNGCEHMQQGDFIVHPPSAKVAHGNGLYLLDHLVGASEQRLRNCQSECFGSLKMLWGG